MTNGRPWKVLMVVAAGLILTLSMAACGGAPDATNSGSAPAGPPQETPDQETPDRATPNRETEEAAKSVAGTIVHFTAGDVVVEAVIEDDNPTTRSFLEMLPMTLTFSDFGGKEKVASPTGKLDFTDAKGLKPEVGDLFSYKPWGNIGFLQHRGQRLLERPDQDRRNQGHRPDQAAWRQEGNHRRRRLTDAGGRSHWTTRSSTPEKDSSSRARTRS